VRILYVCHRFPYPPRRGGKIRPFNTIRHLARSHEVTVASLARSPDEAADGAGIAPYCAAYEMATVSAPAQVLRMVARVPTPMPSSIGYFYSSDLARRVRRRLRNTRYDVIFVHCSSAAQYVADVRGIPKLLDFGDMDSQKWLEYARHKPFPLSLGYRLEGRKLEAEERRLARRFDLCTATTPAEWEQLNRVCGDTPTDWFPNGVDTAYFAPGAEPYDSDSICFVGRMDYYPNQQSMLWFCERVWPELRQHRPRLRLTIVGADPSPAVRRLGELPGITVTGSVPDVRPHLRRAALMVAPLDIARGTQNKILESMAMGVPVVCSKTAAGGVDAVPGEHLLVAGTAQSYVRHILRLLRDPVERQRLAGAARARVLSHHAWDASMRKLDGILERALGHRRFARAALEEARA
jgi:sugar transferase (PEP-CTERM/EpsH1 system associated)